MKKLSAWRRRFSKINAGGLVGKVIQGLAAGGARAFVSWFLDGNGDDFLT
ncbi:hypothetical protein [Streptomyces sp. NPDC050535]